jgi:hypothetical protein
MSRKTTIDALFTKRKPEALGAPNPTEQAAPVVRSGAVAAMGASLQQWSAAQKTAEDLQAQLAAAVTVIEVEPSSIDPAPVRDRLDIESDASFEALMASIRTSGQQVPIGATQQKKKAPNVSAGSLLNWLNNTCRSLRIPLPRIAVKSPFGTNVILAAGILLPD